MFEGTPQEEALSYQRYTWPFDDGKSAYTVKSDEFT